LDTLTKLETLYLEWNQITEIKGLERLDNLRLLFLGLNPIEGGGENEFAQDTMGEDNIKKFLRSYDEWKKG